MPVPISVQQAEKLADVYRKAADVFVPKTFMALPEVQQKEILTAFQPLAQKYGVQYDINKLYNYPDKSLLSQTLNPGLMGMFGEPSRDLLIKSRRGEDVSAQMREMEDVIKQVSQYIPAFQGYQPLERIAPAEPSVAPTVSGFGETLAEEAARKAVTPESLRTYQEPIKTIEQQPGFVYAAGAPTPQPVGKIQHQILNVEEMKKYSPDQYERLPDGRVVLKEGVSPIPGTTKQVARAEAPTPAAPAPTVEPLSKANKLQVALDRIAAGRPESEDQANIDYARSKGMLATLYSSTGEKKVVAVGSDKANNLLSQDWTLDPQPESDIITSDTLKTQTPIDTSNISSSIMEQTSQSSIIKGSAEQTSQSIQDFLKIIERPESDLDRRIAELTGQITTGLEELQGRGAAQLAEEEKQQVQQKREQLTTINNQLQNKLAEINSLDAQYQKEFTDIEGKPIALSKLQGEQGQLYRNYQVTRNVLTSDAGLLQAQALAAQNMLTDAQNAANRAVDLKYADLQDTIDLQLKQLTLLEGQLSKEEQNYANAVNLYLEDRQTEIQDQKDTEKQIQSIALTALNNGADSALVNQIVNANSIIEAAQIGGQLLQSGGWRYVSTPTERDRLRDLGYEITQTGGRTYVRRPEYEAPTTKKVGKDLYQWNPTTGKWELAVGAPSGAYKETAPVGGTYKTGETPSGPPEEELGLTPTQIATSQANYINAHPELGAPEALEEWENLSVADKKAWWKKTPEPEVAEDVEFYITQIGLKNPTFVAMGKIRWDKIPANLRAEVRTRILEKQTEQKAEEERRKIAEEELPWWQKSWISRIPFIK